MAGRYVANLQINVDSTPLPPTVLRDVQSVTISDALTMASTFTLRMNTWDSSHLRITWADSPLFALGQKLEILLGYVDEPLTSLIVGTITDLDVEYQYDQPPTLTITGYDIRHQLAQASGFSSYKAALDSAIVNNVLTKSKVKASVTPTTVTWTSTTQNNETNLAFLNRLAWRSGYDLTVLGEVVRFAPPSIFGPPLPLLMDKDLTNFSVSISTGMLVNEIEIKGTDPSSNQQFVVTADVPTFPGTTMDDEYDAEAAYINDITYPTQAECQAVADAKAIDAANDPLTGSGSGYGNPLLRAGVTIEVNGLGRRFSGSYRLQTVTHAVTADGGYVTSFTAKGAAE